MDTIAFGGGVRKVCLLAGYVFFQSEAEAQGFAFTCIKQVYPELENKNLSEYYLGDSDE
ncbi:TPA: hypothetical protein ACG5A4_004597 [Pseudomonas aeruginosa]